MLYLGSYSSGLVSIQHDRSWSLGKPYAALRNCSFATLSRRGLVYLVDEREDGLIRVCDPSQGWEILGEYLTKGEMPCYVALNRSETRLAVANYQNGSLALFDLDPETGLPLGEALTWQGEGRGPVTDRQEHSHIHCTLFGDGDSLYAVDLGSDHIFCFDGDDPLASVHMVYAAPPGSGPRHLVFHPDGRYAYLGSELASTITVLRRDGRSLIAQAIHSTLPEGFEGESLGGHLSLNAAGTLLYVTNRGHDSIAIFWIGSDGDLRLIQHAPVTGSSPRSFVLLEDDNICAVANEESESIDILPLAADGRLGPAEATLPAPGAAFLFTVA